MAVIDHELLAQIGYETYCEEFNWEHLGSPMAEFHDLSEQSQRAWIAAGKKMAAEYTFSLLKEAGLK